MQKRLPLLFLLAATAGCVATTRNIDPELRSVTSPPIGEIHTVGLGSSMVETALGRQYDVMELKSPFVYDGDGVNEGTMITAEPGFYFATRRDRMGVHYTNMVETCVFEVCAEDVGGFLVQESDNTIEIFDGLRSFPLNQTPDWVATEYPYVESHSARRQLVYNGSSGTIVRLLYREFAEGGQQPASTRELSFDLADDNVIDYEGAGIEVLKAGDVDITYRVLTGFPDS